MSGRDDPTDLLASPLFAGATKEARPGFKTVSARAIPIGPPIRSGDAKADAAAMRLWRAIALDVPDDTTAAGVEAWETMAAQLPRQQAEARELWFADHPDQRPEAKAVAEAPPAEGWTAADAIFRTPMKRR